MAAIALYSPIPVHYIPQAASYSPILMHYRPQATSYSPILVHDEPKAASCSLIPAHHEPEAASLLPTTAMTPYAVEKSVLIVGVVAIGLLTFWLTDWPLPGNHK